MRFSILFSFITLITFTLSSCEGNKNQKNTSEEINKEKPAPTFVMKESNSANGSINKSKKSKNSIKMPSDPNKKQNPENNSNINSTVKQQNTVIKNDQTSDLQVLQTVPNACELISIKQIADVLNVQADAIKQKDASHTKSPFTRSCFYRWEGASPNTGILLQVQANPIAEEYAEWVSLFVESKRTTGEKEMGSNETYKYEKLEGLGDDGSYSHRLGKYFWRDGNKYAFMVAFNTNSAPDVQMKNVQKIGKIMMANYAKMK